jgi:hypothetical protein
MQGKKLKNLTKLYTWTVRIGPVFNMAHITFIDILGESLPNKTPPKRGEGRQED